MSAIAAGTEATATITGRVVHSGPGAIVLEHLTDNGLAHRVAIRMDAHEAVAVSPAEPPGPEQLAARERAARMVATGIRPYGLEDFELKRSADAEWVARWNDAYPSGTRVRYGDEGRTSTTDGAAFMYGGFAACVRVAGEARPVTLGHVEPIGGAA